MIDYTNIKTGVISAIRAAVGSDLFQVENPNDPPNTWGFVKKERTDKNAPILGYPYATIDITEVRDDGSWLHDNYFDSALDAVVYDTVKIINFRITVFNNDGDNTLEICQKLETAFRQPELQTILRNHSDMGIVDTSNPISSPQFYDTDFVEQSFFDLEVRVYDQTIVNNEDYGQAIERVIMTGELDHYEEDPVPVSVNVDAGSNP